jgi:hypothetical protein
VDSRELTVFDSKLVQYLLHNKTGVQTAAVKIEKQVEQYQKIKRGVRQGGVFSPDPYFHYTVK